MKINKVWAIYYCTYEYTQSTQSLYHGIEKLRTKIVALNSGLKRKAL